MHSRTWTARPLSFVSQAGTVRGRGRAGAGNRGPGPRGSYLGGYSAGRGIYSRYHDGKGKLLDKPYELMTNLELAAVNQVGIKPGTSQCEIKPRLYRIQHSCALPQPVEAEISKKNTNSEKLDMWQIAIKGIL